MGEGLGEEGGARAGFALLYFSGNVAGQGNGLERCGMVSGVTTVQPDPFAGSEPPS